MPWILFALFVIVPVIEIALFITVGERIGIVMTIVLVVFTAILGTFLLQMQGLSAMTRAQKAMAEGRVPLDSVVDGVCLLLAGAFLLTPGFLTDGVGFLLFVPWIRRGLAKWVFNKIISSKSVQFEYQDFPGTGAEGQRSGQSEKPQADTIIEGEFEEVVEKPQSAGSVPPHPRKDSPWNKGDP